MPSKLKLNLEALTVDTFDTSAQKGEKGTVFGEACTCWTQCGQNTCPGCLTCDHTCANTCDDATCAGSCNGTCGATCFTCGFSCYDTDCGCPGGQSCLQTACGNILCCA